MGYDYLFLSYAMITKADDMCQTEIHVFESEKGVTCLISQTVTSNTTFNEL